MAWSTAGRNARADATAALISAVGMHTGDPGASGTDNEWSGGAYARQAPAYAAASGGAAALSAPLAFEGPSAAAAAFVSLWNGATFLGSVARASGDAAANAAGEYNVNNLTVNADGTISA
jgi:hypothetical protein